MKTQRHFKNKIMIMGMIVVLLTGLIGCGQKSTDTIVVASKPFTEGYIVAEMVALIIENHTELEVERRYDFVGDAIIIHQGLLEGEIDVYPEYTSTGWFYMLKQQEVIKDHDVLYESLKTAYEAIGLTWTGLYGFNNTYALTIRKDTQAAYGIEKTSDLSAISGELTFGANPDYYEREDGYQALVDFYNLDFSRTMDVNIGLRYQALAEGGVDVINGFTTDGLLEKFDLVPLEDDLNFFADYYAGTVVRVAILEKHPELKTALEKLNGWMTESDLQALNYQVDAEGAEPEAVAKAYLQQKGLID